MNKWISGAEAIPIHIALTFALIHATLALLSTPAVADQVAATETAIATTSDMTTETTTAANSETGSDAHHPEADHHSADTSNDTKDNHPDTSIDTESNENAQEPLSQPLPQLPVTVAATSDDGLSPVVPDQKVILPMGHQHRLQANITLAQSVLMHERPFTILGVELLGMVNKHLSLGLAIHSVASDLDLPSGRDVFMSNTGVLIRGYLFPEHVVHLTGGVLLGMGIAAPAWGLLPDELPYFSWMFAAEPELQIEVNITNTIKLGAGASYVFYHGPYFGADMEDIKQHGVGGITTGLSFKWGIF